MEKTIQKYIALTFLLSVIAGGSMYAVTYFSPRSQATDAARDLVGMANEYHTNLYDTDEFYGTVNLTGEYSQSIRNDRITRCLFGGDFDSCDSILIQGSQVADRSENAWLADYFGLPQDFESRISFSPKVKTFILDFGFYLGFDSWCTGLYFKLHAPFVHTRWRLNPCETEITPGVLPHLGGYFDAGLSESPIRSDNPRSNLLNNALEFFAEGKAPILGTTSNADGATDRVIFDPLQCSRWASCSLDKNGLAAVTAAFGWNFFLEDDYHLGVELRVAAPTGPRPKGCYLFQPIVGNGHYWELGGGLCGHYTFWRCDDTDSSLSFWVDAHIMHLFKTRQNRSFDLSRQGANSRYMLAMRMTSTVTTGLEDDDGAVPTAQFDNLFRPVANLTCCDVKVSSSVQGDVAALFNYTRGCFSWDLGYNFWARSCEKIDFDCGDCPCALQDTEQLWALKGDVRVFGYEDDEGFTSDSTSHALSATNSAATIHGGTNFNATNPFNNSKADNPTEAFFDDIDLVVPTGILANSVPVFLSLNPVTLTGDDIDLCSSRTRGMSHKLFTHFQWTWKDRECWVPYVGIGGMVEFAGGRSCGSSCDTSCTTNGTNGIACSTSCDTDCDSCPRCSLSQWGVWIKGGISFN